MNDLKKYIKIIKEENIKLKQQDEDNEEKLMITDLPKYVSYHEEYLKHRDKNLEYLEVLETAYSKMFFDSFEPDDVWGDDWGEESEIDDNKLNEAIKYALSLI